MFKHNLESLHFGTRKCSFCQVRLFSTHQMFYEKRTLGYRRLQRTSYLQHTNYMISTTARPTILPRSRSLYACPASSNFRFSETATSRLKIPLSANLINLGRSCLALPPYEPITLICTISIKRIQRWKKISCFMLKIIWTTVHPLFNI